MFIQKNELNIHNVNTCVDNPFMKETSNDAFTRKKSLTQTYEKIKFIIRKIETQNFLPFYLIHFKH